MFGSDATHFAPKGAKGSFVAGIYKHSVPTGLKES